MTIADLTALQACRPTQNKGRVVGQKLAIDSNLQGCDPV